MIYILISFITLIFADQRSFIWTYEKIMLQPGESELELYFTNEYPNSDITKNTNINTLMLEAEIEIGMSDNLEVGFYNTFKDYPVFDDNGAFEKREFKYDEYKLRFKYRIFKNNHKLAPIFYTELKGNPDFSSWTIEQKFIFTQKLNNINISFNPILEFENEKEDCQTCSDSYKWNREIEAELAFGISYNRGENFSYGVELKSSEYATYFGPVMAHGSESKWWTIGFMKKLTGNNDKSELILRSIMGFHF